MDVEIKEMPALRTASLRHIGAYVRISEAFARLGDAAGRAGLFKTKPTMLGIFYDDPKTTPEPQLRSDAALVVPEGVAIPEGLTETRVPGGRYAHTTHVGPYEKLSDVWARLKGQWLPQSGLRLGGGATFEIYQNTPAEVPPAKLVTDLYLPLA